MAFNLLDSMRNIFTPDRIHTAAVSLGESEGNIAKALSGIGPAIIGGIITRTDSGIDGASSILNMAKGAAGTGILSTIGTRFGDLTNNEFVANGLDSAKRLLGDKFDSVASSVSRYSGIRESSASSLIALAAPAALGVLGKHATDNNLTAASLSNLLSSQRTSVAAALPVGLGSLTSWITGPGSTVKTMVPPPGETIRHATPPLPDSRVPVPQRRNWLGPILIGLVILLLLIYLMRGCNKTTNSVSAITDTVSNMAVVPSAPLTSIKVKLPDGTELDAYKGGIEDQLVAYLNSTFPGDSISNDRWFDFDNLNFKTGSADITDESMRQVNNIAAILKAYPKVSIKIGGYTDKTGNEDQNLKLSQDRGDAVLNALKGAGVAATQLVGAQGYGSQFAKAPADAPDEQRKPDRRISVSVRSK